ncbi:MAG: 50S ribosomal protein L19 [bacterium]
MTEEKKTEKQEVVEKAKADPAKGSSLQAIKDSLVPGMTVRIYQKIKELNLKGQEKERIQYFEGMIIARKHGKQAGATVTVSKISDGVEVEKIFPLNLPTITKIEIKKQSRVRRSKLYFLKNYKKKLKAKK